ncbi:DUF1798 family protein [Priestia endophytica]|uniref:DUF1798 family protein n=1 Tax=Priestia endophytica TaxID=135735 RepID=UPI002040CF5B|nr:DUF1798 family protein [Priestia endophytica]MCM3536923.1 YppE family protein [Priestia endophytica]
MSNVYKLTEKLLSYNEEASNRLKVVKAKEQSADFYEEVKPYAETFFSLLDEWEKAVRKWILESKPKYVHFTQVDAATENLHNVILQSFHKDTRAKQFSKMYISNKYFLESILAEKEKGA